MNKKIVLVFGAYGGVGSEVARYNYTNNKDACVVLVGRDPKKLAKMQEGYDSKHSLPIVGDANSEADIKRAFSKALKKFGRIDEIWVTVGKDGGFEKDFHAKPKEGLWDKLYPSLLQPLEVILPIAEEVLRKQGFGIFVHLSSHAAFKSEDELPGNHTYRQLKREAEKLVLDMRKRLEGTEATAVNLRPAIINTPGNAKVLKTEEMKKGAVQPEDLAKWVDQNYPSKGREIPESWYFHSDVVI